MDIQRSDHHSQVGYFEHTVSAPALNGERPIFIVPQSAGPAVEIHEVNIIPWGAVAGGNRTVTLRVTGENSGAVGNPATIGNKPTAKRFTVYSGGKDPRVLVPGDVLSLALAAGGALFGDHLVEVVYRPAGGAHG